MNNGWSEYEKLVLSKLDEHGEKIKCVDKKVTDVRIEVAGLKVKAGIWGAIAGLIPVSICIGFWILVLNK